MKKLVIGLMVASLVSVSAVALAEDAKEKDDKTAAKTASDAATTAIDSTPEGAIAEGVLKDSGATAAMEKGADKAGKAIDKSAKHTGEADAREDKRIDKALDPKKKHDDKK